MIDQRTPRQKLQDAIVKKRVCDGIKLLEEKYGDDWYMVIDLDDFDLGSAEFCVLGQLYQNAEVTESDAGRYIAAGRGGYPDSVREAYQLNQADGYFRGLAIIDGPLLEMQHGVGGPERHGFNSSMLSFYDLDRMDADGLEMLGVTRQMVDDVVWSAKARDPSGWIYDCISVGFNALESEWQDRILDRRAQDTATSA